MFNPDDLPVLADEIEAYLTERGADDDTRYMFRKYYPIAWNKPSAHVDAVYIMTPEALLMHARGEEKARASYSRIEEREGRNAKRQRQAVESQQGAEWVEWQRLCSDRKHRIELATAEWRKRVGERNKWMGESQLYVEAARQSMQVAKAEPVPPQPLKVAQ